MTELQLIAALKARDTGALDLFRQQYGPLMRYVMAPILSDDREREECLSDLCLRVWKQINSFDEHKGSFKGWLTVLTRNAALNRARAAQKHWAEDLSPQVADPAPGPEALCGRRWGGFPTGTGRCFTENTGTGSRSLRSPPRLV